MTPAAYCHFCKLPGPHPEPADCIAALQKRHEAAIAAKNQEHARLQEGFSFAVAQLRIIGILERADGALEAADEAVRMARGERA